MGALGQEQIEAIGRLAEALRPHDPHRAKTLRVRQPVDLGSDGDRVV
jgi:hypothetical protein